VQPFPGLFGETFAVGLAVAENGDGFGAPALGEQIACDPALQVVPANHPKTFRNPCSVSFGLVANVEIMRMPASEYTLGAGSAVLDHGWPITFAAFAAISLFAAATA
jgi:hypothetical protein